MGKGGGCAPSKNKGPPVLDSLPSHGVTEATIPVADANSAIVAIPETAPILVADANSAVAAIPETVLPLPAAGEHKYCYDVFLSFRGEDTRQGFTGHLYDALRRRGFNVFRDDEKLRSGEQISPALLTAIEKSRISIVVFSENYASSTWCLDELAKILDCRKQMNQHVLPIFYKVEPSDVRHQRNRYGEAMITHEDRFRNALGKVQEWRSALCEASNLSGLEFKTGYEYEFIDRIAKKAFDLLPKSLYIDEHIVGLQSRVEEVMSLLDIKSNNTVCMVGIHGIGGIGKTTLVKALYNLIADQFEGACYLADIRERSNQFMGLVHLQETLLSKALVNDSVKLSNVDEGASMIRERLCHRRVLLVLDDVNKIEQLEKLAGKCDWFGPGSRIIITTRDKHLLNAHQVENRYEMKVLNDHDSLELFCRIAFKMSHPQIGYEDVSKHAVHFAKGLPLALKVIGSNLIGKDLDEWKCALNKYEKIPHKDIQSILRISYDSLDCNEKDIFLDIACFFKGQNLEYVESILDASGFYPKFGIGVLVDKSLISIEGGQLRMHDLIQNMGKEVVRQEAPLKPGARSRLWFHEDVIEVLSGNLGSSNIQGIMLDPPEREEVEWSGTAFEKMDNLRILIINSACFSPGPSHLPNTLRLLDWKEYPSESLPRGFYPRKIVVLNLCHSRLTLTEPFKKFEYLTMMDFSDCDSIAQIPDMSGVPNLRELKVNKCYNLIEVHDSVGYLNKLVVLDVSRCIKLTSFPRQIQMASLKSLYLDGCVCLDHFPDIMGKMDALSLIRANDTAIQKLPHSFGNLTRLSQLEMRSITRLRELPSNFFMLQNLAWFHFKPSPHIRKSIRKCLRQLSFQFYRKFPKERLGQVKPMQESHSAVICCPKLFGFTLPNCGLLDADLRLILNCFTNLRTLYLSGNDFVSLPQCIEQHDKLELLDVSNCKKLQHIPEIPSNLKKINARNCTSLTTESSSRLWSQVLKEDNELEITMPESPIPDWFHHHCDGGTVSFSISGKFPVVALAFSFGKGNVRARGVRDDFSVSLRINGRLVTRQNNSSSSICNSIGPVVQGNMLLWTPRGSFEEEDWQELDALLVHDWNDVEIQAKCRDLSGLTVKYSAVYVYKPQANLEHIQFKCFDPKNSTTVPTTSEPIKLKGSQAALERLFVEGKFAV